MVFIKVIVCSLYYNFWSMLFSAMESKCLIMHLCCFLQNFLFMLKECTIANPSILLALVNIRLLLV